MKNEKLDQEYSFDLRPASMEEAGLFYSNDEQDEALGTVGHLRLDFGHGFSQSRGIIFYVVERLKALYHNGFNTCYP